MRRRPAISFAIVLALGASRSLAGARQEGGSLETAGHEKGDPAAPLLIIEFADFACSTCAAFARGTMPRVEEEWIRTGRARYRIIPFDMLRTGRDAAVAAECAAEQNAFWPMHDLLYARQRQWLGKGGQKERFEGWAGELGLDRDRLAACQKTDTARKRFESNTRLAREHRVRGTPTFIIGGEMVAGGLEYAQFNEVLERIAGSGRGGEVRQ